MKHLELTNRLNEGLAKHSLEMEAAAAAQHFDAAKVSENLVAGLLKTLLGLKGIRNLNVEERANFPGLDLIDDVARVGVQVTATTTLNKVKETIKTCKKHRIDSRVDRLIVYVLTRRQDTYSQSAIDKIGAAFEFNTKNDIMDFRDLAKKGAEVEPAELLSALEVLESYASGAPNSLDQTKFDPPNGATEVVSLNLLELYIPQKVYVADLVDIGKPGQGKPRGQRQRVRAYAKELGMRLPSDYMISEGRLITFHALDQDEHPFKKIIDAGTVTPLESREFWRIDVDHERVFKGLLRFSVQQKLHKHGVNWFNEENLFVFLPTDNPDLRQESWQGKVKATRSVFMRKINKNDPSKTLNCKHLAFSVDFMVAESGWYVALAPDWYFSRGEDFRRSWFADKNLAWLKRRETNRIVYDHFRFLADWLRDLDQADIFSLASGASYTMTFGEVAKLQGHPKLDDETWLPMKGSALDSESDLADLFDHL